MAAFRQDFTYAARFLRKQPAFTAMAVAMLALGIGATVAIFALVNAVILKPLPFEDPDRLMLVHLLSPAREAGEPRPMIWSYPKYQVFRDHQRAFESTAPYAAWNWNLTGSGLPERLDGEMVDASYFQVLRLSATVGRTFAAEETRTPGSPPLAILGHRIWTERYGSSTEMLGRAIGLNGIPHTIVGVMPAGFRGLTGQADLWVPLTTQSAGDLEERWNHTYYVVARRKADIVGGAGGRGRQARWRSRARADRESVRGSREWRAVERHRGSVWTTSVSIRSSAARFCCSWEPLHRCC